MDKIGENSVFSTMTKQQKDAIKLLFEDDLTDEEIAKKVHRSTSTLYNWKKDLKFRKAQDEYALIAIKSDYKNQAVHRLVYLMKHGESGNVQLQAANSIIKLAGLYNQKDDPEVKEAQLKMLKANATKAEAEAEVAKAQSEQLHTVANNTREKMAKLSVEELRSIAKMAGEDND